MGQRGGGLHHHGQEQAETEARASGDETKDFRGWLEKKSVFSVIEDITDIFSEVFL